MVAVLTVFACHLWGWPPGGFIGVDVFFVISGFLITGNLLRTAEVNGNVSFRAFYWNRIRRIVPAATLVLLLTYLACLFVFLPFRAHQVGVDALFAFVFLSNWRFAIQDTDYFARTDALSPLQHYWSLSIEEQFYFVWPAIIFLISLIILRTGRSHRRRMQLAGAVMALIITASFSWAVWETSSKPAWAYFDTFARVWELGVGALLAASAGSFSRLSPRIKILMSWAGLGLITASIFLLRENSLGFPAPWALLPVVGASLVIAAGVGREPRQWLLQNPVSTYVGDISYSLYLVHWPVIVIVAALMEPSLNYSICVIALSFALATASYHLVENPLRRVDSKKLREAFDALTKRRLQLNPATKYGAVAAATLAAVGLAAYTTRPDAYQKTLPPALAATNTESAPPEEGVAGGPATTALQTEIAAALESTEWPTLDPAIDAIANDPAIAATAPGCGGTFQAKPENCVWGPDTAATKVLVVGNSVALYYTETLREIALDSDGAVQVRTLAMPGCSFVNELIFTNDPTYLAACPNRKQEVVDYINATRPDVVVISNNYAEKQIAGSDRVLSPDEWTDSMGQLIDQFRDNVGQIVLLAPPPGDVDITDCVAKRTNRPPDCIGRPSSTWRTMAAAERRFAESIGATFIDSRPWFCSPRGFCPSFVGSTPTKLDAAHMLPAYGRKIQAAFREAFDGII